MLQKKSRARIARGFFVPDNNSTLGDSSKHQPSKSICHVNLTFAFEVPQRYGYSLVIVQNLSVLI